MLSLPLRKERTNQKLLAGEDAAKIYAYFAPWAFIIWFLGFEPHKTSCRICHAAECLGVEN